MHVEIYIEKMSKNERKSRILASPNPPKMSSKSMSQKTCNFSSIFARILMLVARANIKKNVHPRSVLPAFHTIQRFTCCMHFWFKKPAKNRFKTMSEPFKNRCKKRVVFHHRFFWALASNLEPLGLQVGCLGLPRPSPKHSKSSLVGARVQDASQEAPKWLQKESQGKPRAQFSKVFR